MLVLGIIVLIFLLLYLFLIFPSLRRHKDRKWMSGLYVAHRGLHVAEMGAPENSMNAFLLAKKMGYGIEIDIHLTKDGQVVVFHDDTTGRVCEQNLSVEGSTLDQLRQLHLSGTDQTIPTLQEVLDLVDGAVPLLIEFKCVRGNSGALCSAADQILSGYRGKYLIQSFYPPVLHWYRQHRSEICRGQLSCDFLKQPKEQRKLPNILSGWLLFNFLARPDFISYSVQDAGAMSFVLCKMLGAFSAGWTIRTDRELAAAKRHFQLYIFEHIVPEK